MRGFKVKTVIASLVVSTAMAPSMLAQSQDTRNGTPSVTSVTYPLVKKLSEDITLVQYDSERAVEQLRGTAALAHLQNLRSREPQALIASIKNMKEHGFRPTDHVFVERHLRLARNTSQSGPPPYSLTQTSSEANSDGEIVFWSWDDGDNSTWEGTIYVEIYSDGAASTWDGQIYDETEDHPWVWYQKTWERDPVDRRIAFPPLPGTRSNDRFLLTNSAIALRPQFDLVGFYEWATCWRAAVVGGCSGAAWTCRRTGPLWPECFAYGCTGAEIAGAIGCYYIK